MDLEPPTRERYCLRIALQPVPEITVAGLREVRDEDQQGLGMLMYDAYLDTVDYEGETEAQAVEELRKTCAGGYGPFMPECSRLIEREGRVVSAVLVSLYEGRAMIAYTMTHPDFHRQGLALALMQSAMNALHSHGEEEVFLAVTAANTPALTLYQKLGFEIVTPPPPRERRDMDKNPAVSPAIT